MAKSTTGVDSVTVAGGDRPISNPGMPLAIGGIPKIGPSGMPLIRDRASCCCDGPPTGCSPYPKCVSYEHGPAASGGGLKKCGLMLPSTGGPDRVRASCHIRGRLPNYNGSGAATDIVRYWLHGSTLPQITDWPRPMCPQWVASAADGCLVLTEFTEQATLAVVYRDGSSASVDVVAHAFTDGKRWKVTCTPDGNGEIYTGQGSSRTVTDTRIFTSLDFDGGTDGGYCEGTLAERDHTSRLVISDIDPAAFTDDAKYWVVVAVPPNTAIPSQPDSTCRKPQSVECFNDSSRTLPTVVKWKISGSETNTYHAEQYGISQNTGLPTLKYYEKYSGNTMTNASGRECALGQIACYGVLRPNSNCIRTVNNSITEPTYRLEQTGRSYSKDDDGRIYNDINFDGTSTAFWDPANCIVNTGGAAGFSDIPNLFCYLVSAGKLTDSHASFAFQELTQGTGYLSNTTGRPVAGVRWGINPGSPNGSYVFKDATRDQSWAWSTVLGQTFIECKSSYSQNDTLFNGGFIRRSYTATVRLTIEPDPLACPPAGGVVGIPPQDSAIAALDSYFRSLR